MCSSDLAFTDVAGQELRTLALTHHDFTSQAELISKLSRGVTLEKGSLILTGSPTPLRRATAANPWLRHGDEVRAEVEGCGTSSVASVGYSYVLPTEAFPPGTLINTVVVTPSNHKL